MRRLEKRSFIIFSLGLVLICLATAGCGYRLAGGGSLPAGVTTLCITIFENRSSESGIENKLVSDLIAEFTRNGQTIVDDPAKAQGILGGVVKSVSVESVSASSDQTTLESRVIVVADVVLKNVEGEEIWSADNLRERQAYETNRGDKQMEEQSRREALTTLSRRFAETVYGRMTENF